MARRKCEIEVSSLLYAIVQEGKKRPGKRKRKKKIEDRIRNEPSPTLLRGCVRVDEFPWGSFVTIRD